MDSLPLPLDDLKRLVSLFDEHRLLELELREGPVRVHLQTQTNRAVASSSDVPVSVGEAPMIEEEWVEEAVSSASEPTPEDKGWLPLHAPITGTFYRAPGPDDPNFVEVGDKVEASQTFGLIEAMKIFSEIPCEVSGTLMEIVVTAGQMVPSGQILAWIQP